MALSAPATNIEVGLVRHPLAAVITALKLSAKFGTCERAIEGGLLSREVGCEELMKLRRVEVQ